MSNPTDVIYPEREPILRRFAEVSGRLGAFPTDWSAFAKSLGQEPHGLREHFDDFEQMHQATWVWLFKQTLGKLEEDPVYLDYSVREKMLAFYFTWLEALEEHRPFAKLSLARDWARPSLLPAGLEALRGKFDQYVASLLDEGEQTGEVLRRPILTDQLAKTLWLKLVFVLRFWCKDESPSRERTDAAVEKAVHLAFDLLGRTPLDTAFDLGKFLWQSRGGR